VAEVGGLEPSVPLMLLLVGESLGRWDQDLISSVLPVLWGSLPQDQVWGRCCRGPKIGLSAVGPRPHASVPPPHGAKAPSPNGTWVGPRATSIWKFWFVRLAMSQFGNEPVWGDPVPGARLPGLPR